MLYYDFEIKGIRRIKKISGSDKINNKKIEINRNKYKQIV